MKQIRIPLLLLLIASCLFYFGCREKGVPSKTEENSSLQITMTDILSANHPDERLKGNDSLLIRKSANAITFLYADKKGHILEYNQNNKDARLILNQEREITKTGSILENHAFAVDDFSKKPTPISFSPLPHRIGKTCKKSPKRKILTK